jgi:hypothetical protein
VVKPFRPSQVLITVANAGRRRCLEIMRRRYQERLETHIEEQAVDLGHALIELKAAQTDVALAPSDARLRTLVDIAPEAVVGLDGDGYVTVFNVQAERLTGYGRDEVLGHRLDVLVPSGGDTLVAEPGTDPAHAPAPRRVDVTMRRKDGSQLPVHAKVAAVESGEGVLVTAVLTPARAGASAAGTRLDDIVRSSHRGLLDAAPDAMVCIDVDGSIVLVNAQAEKLLGYTRDELMGQPAGVLLPEEMQEGLTTWHESFVADPQPRPAGPEMEVAIVRKDGSRFPAELSVSAIETDDGLLVTAALRDMTDRNRADARFRALLEAAPDAIVAVDIDGVIALVNAQAEGMFGYTRTELVGQKVELLVPEAARAAHVGHRIAYFGDLRPRPMGARAQLAARRKDGSELPVEISLGAIETEDGVLAAATVRDLTERLEIQAERERLRAQAEREHLESQLHEARRLESLGQLAGGVAHDFNNLLAVILNYTAFIREEVAAAAEGGGPGDERWQAVYDDVTQVQKAADRAARLTHQLLAFGRREVVRPEVLDLNDVIADVGHILQRSMGEHVELSTSLAPQLWPVLADPGQIEQVLLNLAVNARDAMPGGGTLTIATDNLTVEDAPDADRDLEPGRYVRLQVGDTGTGMDPEVIRHAFEPFYTTKAKGEGTGLGLATVYGTISQADGQVNISSEPGVGTMITAVLPATEEPSRRPARDLEAPPRHDGATVLLVEDEDAMREVTRRILARNGRQVLTAATGEDAVALASTHEGDIDLLLSDVIMPQMLGREVAQRVAAIRPGIRVLYMSGYAQPVLASRGTLDEGVALIEKPFTESALLNRIDAVLDG